MRTVTIEDGDDWVVVKVNDERVYAGHQIPYHVWKEIFGMFGVTLNSKFGDFEDDDDTKFIEDV